MDCGGVFVKYVLFLFNILFVICGVLLIVFGSLILVQVKDIRSIEEAVLANNVAIALLIVGCIIFVIAFFGCCGAIREQTCCTMTYSVFMLVLFICQAILIVYVWNARDKTLSNLEKGVDKIWEQRHVDQNVMDVLQITFKCCGKNGFTDYVTALENIPNSCCGLKADSCGVTDVTVLSRPGCSRAIVSAWTKNIDIIRYAGLGVAAVELVAFIFACCLANQIRNGRRRTMY